MGGLIDPGGVVGTARAPLALWHTSTCAAALPLGEPRDLRFKRLGLVGTASD
jgi:hypothetical protein